MTVALPSQEVAEKLEARFAGSVISSGPGGVLVNSPALHDVISWLKTTPGMDFNYLSCITAADYFDYFEVVYKLVSMSHNHSLTIRTRCEGRDNLSVPSITDLYQGAAYQEREVYDLMGIGFEGHHNLKRIFLWDGFEGHPLRKDYL